MAAVSTLRWILVLAASFLGAVAVVENWRVLLAWLIRRKHSSTIPVFGGGLLAGAIALSPGPALRPLWWLPLILDPGCLPLLLTTSIFWLRGGYRSNRQPPAP